MLIQHAQKEFIIITTIQLKLAQTSHVGTNKMPTFNVILLKHFYSETFIVL